MSKAVQGRRSITVNGRFLSQAITGVQRHAHELLRTLDTLLTTGAIEAVPVTVLVPPNAREIPTWSSLRVRQVGRLTGQLWEQFDLPRYTRGTLLFTPCGGAPIVHRHHVVIIPDAGAFSTPEAYTAAYRNYYRVLHRILAHTAAHVITVSEFSRGELSRYLKMPAEKISAIHVSGQHFLRRERADAVLAKHHLIPGRYILGVGSRNPNKNLRGLVAACGHLRNQDFPLAIAGGGNSAIFGDMPNLPAYVRQLGFVTDAELRSLYENAACFVFPSFYEGFGSPPVEALTLGCPVIVSRAASMPEVLQDAAVYCDPHSPEDIAQQITRVLSGDHPSRERALERAAELTWEKCARETWSILLRALETN